MKQSKEMFELSLIFYDVLSNNVCKCTRQQSRAKEELSSADRYEVEIDFDAGTLHVSVPTTLH